jgi:hypothetical protein
MTLAPKTSPSKPRAGGRWRLIGVGLLVAVIAILAYEAGRMDVLKNLSTAGLDPFAASTDAGVPAATRERLVRGINLSFWFTYRGDASIDPRQWQPDSEDLRRLRSIGFRHVRIPVDASWLGDAKNPSVPDAGHLAELRAALDELAGDDLLAVIALDGKQDWKNRLATDPATLDAAAALWQATASAFATLPADKLVFEVLNEPGIDDTGVSQRIMQRLHDAVRAAAPKHSIAIAGPKFSSVPELVQITPLSDANVIYSFHFYEPFNFTHQGATWGWPLWAKFRGWPYPSSPEAVAPLLATADPEVQPHLKFYGDQHWDRSKLAVPLDQAADWARQHKLTIWCGEFGAMKTYSTPASRDAWLLDTRELMDARGILWTHFDYLNHFGIAGGQQGARDYDAGALAALGLSPP